MVMLHSIPNDFNSLAACIPSQVAGIYRWVSTILSELRRQLTEIYRRVLAIELLSLANTRLVAVVYIFSSSYATLGQI